MCTPPLIVLVLLVSYQARHVGSLKTGSKQDIVSASYNYLLKHECKGTKWGLPYQFYRPSLQKYPADQWLWDSCAHMIVWSHANVTNARNDMLTLLSLQRSDGRVPEINFWSAAPEYWLEHAMKTIWFSSDRSTDLTQMPLLPYALRAIHTAQPDAVFLHEQLIKIARYLDWWGRVRDIDGDGLVWIIHPWESGLDASPLYDIVHGITDPHPRLLQLYPKFVALLLSYKLWFGWNQTAITTSGNKRSLLPRFLVADVGVNSVYAAGWGVLADLAGEVDPALAEQYSARNRGAEAAVMRQCYDPQQGFFSLYKDASGATQHSSVETAQVLLPLLMRSLPPEAAQRIVHAQLLNTSRFWTEYPIPSTSKAAAQYEPVARELMWRGPVWPMINWLVMEGLHTHGFQIQQDLLLDRWVKLYLKSGIFEQYNPESGAPYGPEGLGMSTLIVDWLCRLGRITCGASCQPDIA